MIWRPAHDRRCAIDLFGQHGPDQGVRPGLGSKGETFLRRGQDLGVKAIRAADNDNEFADPVVAKLGQVAGEGARGTCGAVFIAGDDVGAVQTIQQGIRFARFAGLSRLYLDNLNRSQTMSPPRRCRADGIVLSERGLSPAPQLADTEQSDLQRGLDAHPAMGGVYGPDLLQIIKTAYFGPEDMDNDVAGVDQHPVASGHALDLGPAVAGILDRPQQVVGDRADVTMRPP